MKKFLPVIFCFFVVFNFIKPSISLASCHCFRFHGQLFECIGIGRIRCLDRSDYLSSLRSLWPSNLIKDNEKIFDNLGDEDTIWEIFKELNGDLYVVRNFSNENIWKSIPTLVPPMLILEKNSDESFKIKNYYFGNYVVIDQDGYLNPTNNKNKASDFILEPIKRQNKQIILNIPIDEYDDLDLAPYFNLDCNIS